MKFNIAATIESVQKRTSLGLHWFADPSNTRLVAILAAIAVAYGYVLVKIDLSARLGPYEFYLGYASYLIGFLIAFVGLIAKAHEWANKPKKEAQAEDQRIKIDAIYRETVGRAQEALLDVSPADLTDQTKHRPNLSKSTRDYKPQISEDSPLARRRIPKVYIATVAVLCSVLIALIVYGICFPSPQTISKSETSVPASKPVDQVQPPVNAETKNELTKRQDEQQSKAASPTPTQTPTLALTPTPTLTATPTPPNSRLGHASESKKKIEKPKSASCQDQLIAKLQQLSETPFFLEDHHTVTGCDGIAYDFVVTYMPYRGCGLELRADQRDRPDYNEFNEGDRTHNYTYKLGGKEIIVNFMKVEDKSCKFRFTDKSENSRPN